MIGETLDGPFRKAARATLEASLEVFKDKRVMDTTLMVLANSAQDSAVILNVGDGHICIDGNGIPSKDNPANYIIPFAPHDCTPQADEETFALRHVAENKSGYSIQSGQFRSFLVSTDGIDVIIRWLYRKEGVLPVCNKLGPALLSRLFVNIRTGVFDVVPFLIGQTGKKGDDLGLVVTTPKSSTTLVPRTWTTLGIEQNELFSGVFLSGVGPAYAKTSIIEDERENISISALVRVSSSEKSGLLARVTVESILQRVFDNWFRGKRSVEEGQQFLATIVAEYEANPAIGQCGIILSYHKGPTIIARSGPVAFMAPTGLSTEPFVVGDPSSSTGLLVLKNAPERVVMSDSHANALAAGEHVSKSLRNEVVAFDDLEFSKWNGMEAFKAIAPLDEGGSFLVFANRWCYSSDEPTRLSRVLLTAPFGLNRTGSHERTTEEELNRIYGPFPPTEQAESPSTAATTDDKPTVPPETSPQTASAPDAEKGKAQNKPTEPFDAVAISKKLPKSPKVTFSPEWKQEYDATWKPLPPDPDWIEIEGYGRVSREQALAGKFTERGAIVELVDGRVVRLLWLPEGWKNTIMKKM